MRTTDWTNLCEAIRSIKPDTSGETDQIVKAINEITKELHSGMSKLTESILESKESHIDVEIFHKYSQDVINISMKPQTSLHLRIH